MKKIILILLLSLTPLLHAGGNGVGNSGGFILCADQQLYSYDYVIARKNKTSSADHYEKEVSGYLQHISNQLKRLNDPLAKEFNLFVDAMFTQKAGSLYQWFERSPLQLMWEPGLEGLFPADCKTRKQAVYNFQTMPGIATISYVYDPKLIDQVLRQKDGALQISYLWVHEWLWNYFSRETAVEMAYFNRLLHSEALMQMTPEQFARIRPKTK